MGKRFRKMRKRAVAPFLRVWRLQTMTVRVIIADTQGRILVLRRSQTDPRRPGTWDLPGGRVDYGEDPRVTGARETREEAGLIISPARLGLVDLISSYRRDDRKNGRNAWRKWWGNILIMEYLVPVAHPDGPWNGGLEKGIVTLSHEHDDFAWLSLDARDLASLSMSAKYKVALLRWGARRSEVSGGYGSQVHE